MKGRQAVIDVGSSAVKYGVYDFDCVPPALLAEGEPVATSLGRGMKEGMELPRRARESTLRVVEGFLAEIQALKASPALICTTQAVRLARDRESFLESLRNLAGPNTRVICITPRTEAAWGLLSARHTLSLCAEETCLLIDPGGSSNDLALLSPAGERWRSLPYGMNDLLREVPVEEHQATLEAKELEHLRTFLRQRYAALDDWLKEGSIDRLIGTSGAALALGAVQAGVKRDRRQERIAAAHGLRLSRESISRMIDATAPLEAAGRRALHPCLSPTRSIIFVHGALIYEVLLDVLGLEAMTINGYGMKLGGLIALSGTGIAPEDEHK